MFNYGKTLVRDFDTVTNFENLGTIDITRMQGGIPYYSLFLRGNMLHNEKETCGGDCFQYINDNL